MDQRKNIKQTCRQLNFIGELGHCPQPGAASGDAGAEISTYVLNF